METISTSSITILDLISLTQDVIALNALYLGISVTILLAMGAAFYVFSFKPVQEKITNQEGKLELERKDNEEKFKELTRVLIKTQEKAAVLLDQTRDETSSAIDGFRHENDIKLSKTLKDESEKIYLEIDKKIAVLDKALSDDLKNLTNKQSTSQIDSGKQLTSIASKVADVKFDIKELMAFKYQQEGKFGGVMYSIELLEDIIRERGCKNPHIQYRLMDLRDRIKDEPLDAEYIQRIKDILRKLKDGGFKDPDSIMDQVKDNIKGKG